MLARSIRVVPAECGWALQVDHLREPLRFATLKAAIAAGWGYAQRETTELLIHTLDGHVRLRSACSDDHQEPQR
ncbi:conserved hypothetical protein [Cupriavidus necator]|uniref:DUF2188 domain-containing protein n=1 Tax=Cupriavidus necator TaxID=106590 RepID=A0A1K0IQL2_CUPNE|nr:conserved hypothetical protein [Cupriavidus necator]